MHCALRPCFLFCVFVGIATVCTAEGPVSAPKDAYLDNAPDRVQEKCATESHHKQRINYRLTKIFGSKSLKFPSSKSKHESNHNEPGSNTQQLKQTLWVHPALKKTPQGQRRWVYAHLDRKRSSVVNNKENNNNNNNNNNVNLDHKRSIRSIRPKRFSGHGHHSSSDGGSILDAGSDYSSRHSEIGSSSSGDSGWFSGGSSSSSDIFETDDIDLWEDERYQVWTPSLEEQYASECGDASIWDYRCDRSTWYRNHVDINGKGLGVFGTIAVIVGVLLGSACVYSVCRYCEGL